MSTISTKQMPDRSWYAVGAVNDPGLRFLQAYKLTEAEAVEAVNRQLEQLGHIRRSARRVPSQAKEI